MTTGYIPTRTAASGRAAASRQSTTIVRVSSSGRTPTGPPGLVGWYRADLGLYQDAAGTTPAVADGDPVGLWQDQSGQGHHLQQSTPTKRPLLKLAIINGLPVLRGDGNDDILTATFTLIQPAQVTLVLIQRSWTTLRNVLDGGLDGTMLLQQRTATPNISMFAGSAVANAAGPAIGAPGIISALFQGAASQWWLNGTSAATGNPGTASPGGLSVFQEVTGGTGAAVDIAEVILTNQQLSRDARRALEGYFSRRYGITVV